MQQQAYEQLCKVGDTYWYHHGVRKLVETYLKRICDEPGRPLKILDVGCGVGSMFNMLQKYGQVTGLELSDYAVKLCRQKHPDSDIKMGSANNLSGLFPKSSFDLITFVNVLYHKWIEDDKEVIRQTFEIIKPGGYIVLVDPAFKCLYRDNDKICYGLRRYSRKDVQNILRDTGFSLVSSTYFNSVSFVPALILSFVQRFGFFRVHKASSELGELPNFINQTLKGIMFLERVWINIIGLMPLGVSVLSVARKTQ